MQDIDRETAVIDRETALEADKELDAADVSLPIVPDGCCHKTRLAGSSCPLGWVCPYITET